MDTDLRDDGLPYSIAFKGEEYWTPDFDTLEGWMLWDNEAEALDECAVEPDGTCPHGFPSWLRALGLM